MASCASGFAGRNGSTGVSGRGRSSSRIDGGGTGEIAAQGGAGAPQGNIVRATVGETAAVAAEEGEGLAGPTGERGPSLAPAATSAPASATLNAAAVAAGAAASSAAGLGGTAATFPSERSNSGSGSSAGRDGRGYVSAPAAPPVAPSSPPPGLPPPQHASAAEIPLLSQQQFPPQQQQQQQQQQGGQSGEDEEARAAPAPYGAVLAVYGALSAVTAASALGCGGCVLMLGLLADYSKAVTGDFWSTLRQLYTMALALVVAGVEAADWLAPSLISNCCPVFDYWVAKGLLQLLVAVLTNTDLEIQAHTASNSTEVALSLPWSSSLRRRSSAAVLSLRTFSPTPPPPPPPLPLPLPPAPAPSVPPSPSTELLQRVETISLLLLLACAAVHVVGGVLCLGRLKAYVQQRHRQHSQLLRELRDIERRRNVLRRGLLQPPPTQRPATSTSSTVIGR